MSKQGKDEDKVIVRAVGGMLPQRTFIIPCSFDATRDEHVMIPGAQELPTPDPDSTAAYLALAKEDTERAIAHLSLACGDSRVDASVREKALDALRDALTAIEAQMEADNAQP